MAEIPQAVACFGTGFPACVRSVLIVAVMALAPVRATEMADLVGIWSNQMDGFNESKILIPADGRGYFASMHGLFACSMVLREDHLDIRILADGSKADEVFTTTIHQEGALTTLRRGSTEFVRIDTTVPPDPAERIHAKLAGMWAKERLEIGAYYDDVAVQMHPKASGLILIRDLMRNPRFRMLTIDEANTTKRIIRNDADGSLTLFLKVSTRGRVILLPAELHDKIQYDVADDITVGPEVSLVPPGVLDQVTAVIPAVRQSASWSRCRLGSCRIDYMIRSLTFTSLTEDEVVATLAILIPEDRESEYLLRIKKEEGAK